MNEENKKWAGPSQAPGPAELADRYAIGQLPKIYGIGLDLRDYDLCRSAFAPDAQGEGKNGLESIDEYLPNIYRMASSFHMTQHVISNQYISLEGDEALVVSYAVAHHKVAPGEAREDIIATVNYSDRCRRYPHGWLITERRMALKWMDRAIPKAAS